MKEVWISGSPEPNAWVDIAATREAKVAALRAHVSQIGPGEWIESLLRGWAERDGKRAGLALAERFKRLTL